MTEDRARYKAGDIIPAPVAGAAAELVDLARRIHAWGQARGASNSRMLRDYPGLGSDKTWSRLRQGATDEYDIEAQLAAYRATWAVIEGVDPDGAAEPLFDDLNAVVQVKRAMLETMRAAGNARVIIIEGSSGIGKSAALALAAARYGKRVIMIEASDCWADAPGAMLAALLRALGCADVPTSRAERLSTAVDLLGRSRRCCVVDEAHHLGPHCLNTLKTLVNQTPGEFLLACIPTLWARLESKSYLEARQLTTNRLAERVKLALSQADIVRYLRHALPDAAEAALKAGARLIHPAALGHGNFAFVRDVAGAVRRLAADGQPDAKIFADAVEAAAARR